MSEYGIEKQKISCFFCSRDFIIILEPNLRRSEIIDANIVVCPFCGEEIEKRGRQ